MADLESGREAMTEYLRFQATLPTARGAFTGIFGIVNRLSREGALTVDEERFRQVNNAWFDAHFTNPVDVDPDVYAAHPGAVAWFTSTAGDLIERTTGYLRITRAHEVGCAVVRSNDPGLIVYEDEHQVVAVPWFATRPGR